MKTNIQSVQFAADQKLLDFVERKLGKLEQFFDRIIDAEVFLSLDSKNSSVKDKVAKVKVNIPGQQLVASETSKIFEEAVDLATDSIRRQLKRHKEKIRG